MIPDSLAELSRLIREKNEHDARMTALVGRPALIGHVGEFIASRIFGIRLHESASHRGSDGVFAEGELSGSTVNIKWYARNEGLLDLHESAPADYYLVMTGPPPSGAVVKGGVRPWLITHVFLFESMALHAALSEAGTKIGVASSVRRAHWDAAEIFPTPQNPRLTLTAEQREWLDLFS